MSGWNPVPGDHWIYDNLSDQPGRLRSGTSAQEGIVRRMMIEDARGLISQGWRVVRSGRDRIIVEFRGPRNESTVGFPRIGERRELTVRMCPGPPVCTSCERARKDGQRRVQRLFDQGVRDMRKRLRRGGRRRR